MFRKVVIYEELELRISDFLIDSLEFHIKPGNKKFRLKTISMLKSGP
jgi:hypothetical protein